MNTYRPTIIESRLLIERLAIQISFLKNELKRDPVGFGRQTIRNFSNAGKQLVSNSNALLAITSAIILVASVVLVSLLLERVTTASDDHASMTDSSIEFVILDDTAPPESSKKESVAGKDGQGRVGFNKDKGEGSGDVRKLAQGGGGGGNRDPNPPQVGKIPPPSNILASIPITPPLNPPSLPVAGIDIDPALWKDIKAPVYGDPQSRSEIPSKGPGEGEGIGTNNGLGIGRGNGPGVGPGDGGNMGGGSREFGCCGSGSGADESGRTFTGREVEQRARLLSKPEPQYTEEARKNAINGTVILRVVFASSGDVVQIRALSTLPFGLTERAIAAARQIKFVPAMKGGRPVSVQMQLEYNFNLY